MRSSLALISLFALLCCSACEGPSGPSAEATPAMKPLERARKLAAPCLKRMRKPAKLHVKLALAEDGTPTAVIVTGTRDAIARGCVAKAFKSVAFPQVGPRLELELGDAPSAGG